ncbi:hypothetical protein MMC31_003607 [Peltigera leucophlebia]|nr:hypothetical protein [Peltigera leucophlebia]
MKSSALLLATCVENQGLEAVIAVAVTFFLATVIVVVRFYIRVVMLHGATGWDDYFILGSLVSGGVSLALYVKLFLSGMGRHVYCLSIEQVLDVAKWVLLSEVGVATTLGLLKISVCLFVLRVVDKARKGIAKAIWLLIYFVALTHILQLIIYLVQCRPLAAVWSTKVKGRCFSTHIVYMFAYLNYGIEMFTDVVCIGIVIYITHSLKMKRRTKIALYGLMGFGYFTVACHIIATVALRGVFESDYSWGVVKPSMWVGHSVNVGIITASLPTLRPIFKLYSGEKFCQFFSQLLQSRWRTNSSKLSSKSRSHGEKESFKGLDDGNKAMMNTSQTSQQAVTLSNQKLDTSQLSGLPQNSVLVTTSFSHSIGSTRQDLESGSLVTEIYGNK